MLLPSHSDTVVTLAASSKSLAPTDRATMAVVPADTAIKTACKAKNTRLPVVTDATAEAPREPTILMLTKPITENNRLLIMAGQASCQILNCGLSILGVLSVLESVIIRQARSRDAGPVAMQ